MKDQERKSDPKGYGNDSPAHRKILNFTTKLLITLVGIILVAGVVYGVIFISSLYSITTEISNRPKTHKITSLPQEVPPVAVAPPPATPPPAPPKPTLQAPPTKPVEPIQPDTATDYEAEDADNEAAEMEEEVPPIQKEIQELRAALPNNMLVPAERSETEINELIGLAQEQQTLQESIDKGEATAEQRQRYYDIRARQLEDEVELIKHCNQVVANLSDDDSNPHELCTETAKDGEKRLRDIADELEQLRQKLF